MFLKKRQMDECDNLIKNDRRRKGYGVIPRWRGEDHTHKKAEINE